MLTVKLRSDAAMRDDDKLYVIREFPTAAHHFVSRELCAAAEARRESFWQAHKMQCLRDFKHRYNGRVPYCGDMVW